VIRYLLLAIFITLLARAFLRVLDAVIDAVGGRQPRSGPPVRAVKLTRDPICGTFVAPSTAIALSGEQGGAAHFFCSERCRDEFLRVRGPGSRSQAS